MRKKQNQRKTNLHNIKILIDFKKRQKKTYPRTKIKRGEETKDSLFLEFLIDNAEKETYDTG